jgi:hypothetical protein
MDTITVKCDHCGAKKNVFVQPDVEWMSKVRRMEREHTALLEACKAALDYCEHPNKRAVFDVENQLRAAIDAAGGEGAE